MGSVPEDSLRVAEYKGGGDRGGSGAGNKPPASDGLRAGRRRQHVQARAVGSDPWGRNMNTRCELFKGPFSKTFGLIDY